MKDSRDQPELQQAPESAELGLQRAIAISQGTCWTEDGSGGVIIHGGYKAIRISRDARYRINCHAGNDDAIEEILDELAKTNVRPRIREADRRRSFK